MTDSDVNNSYLKEFNSFLNQLKQLFSDNEKTKEEFSIITKIIDEDDELKIKRGHEFHSFLCDEDIFDFFLNRKVGVFSSKNENTDNLSNSLLGKELPLKKLVNKQTEKTKEIIWNYLHTFYLLHESLLNEEDQNIDRIENTIKKNKGSIEMMNKINNSSSMDPAVKERKEKFTNSLLDMDLNSSTTSMIDDIINSFESKVSKSKDANPMESIMEITDLIANKYSDKIESGEIKIEDLLKNMQSNLPGLENLTSGLGLGNLANLGGDTAPKKEPEVTIIDENFSTDQVELGLEDEPKKGGFNMTDGLKMLNNLNSNPEFKKMFEMMNQDVEDDSDESPMDVLNKMKGNLPDDFTKQMEEGMKNMPNIFSKMMNMDGMDELKEMLDEETDSKTDFDENLVEDSNGILESNSVDIDDLTSKYGLNEMNADSNQDMID
tara:strand:+ start:443 stop:1747 length:1305 start_codon:yes stop_codon:yes gene_type:complete